MDGMTGFPEAVRAVYPATRVQLCIVRMVRNATRFVSRKDLKKICADLKAVYSAATEEAGRDALEDFGKIWNGKYPMMRTFSPIPVLGQPLGRPRRVFQIPPEIRKAIYTANAIESLNYRLRKVTKNRSAFPNDEAIFKILYLAIRNASEKWTMPIRDWGMALNQFAVIFGNERVPF
jgi:transposase-like protein